MSLTVFVDVLKGEKAPSARALGLGTLGFAQLLLVPIALFALFPPIQVLRARAAGRRFARDLRLRAPARSRLILQEKPPVILLLEEKIAPAPSRLMAFAQLVGERTAVTDSLAFFNRTILPGGTRTSLA